ncbi:hypothetical protein JNK13_09960 [bacterium]|nr:hypothetical protein [bacterium]
MSHRNVLLIALVLALVFVHSAAACDLCAIYSSLESHKPAPQRLQLTLAEQYTNFDEIRVEGKKIENEHDQYVRSSITQVMGTYDFNERYGAKLILPYIDRQYKKFEDNTTEKGSESGIGDVILLASYFPYRYAEKDTYFSAQLLFGLKLPTGDTALLKPEEHDEHHEDMPAADETDHEDEVEHDHHMMEHQKIQTLHGDEDHGDEGHAEEQMAHAVHGHDLSLGSGSVDVPLVLNLFYEVHRTFVRASINYSLRTEGDYDYRYADDLLWDFGPGHYFYMGEDQQIAARLNISGEHKGKDKRDGVVDPATSVDSIFWGPEIILVSNSNLFANFEIDFPIDYDSSGTQIAPSYRVRGGLTYRF